MSQGAQERPFRLVMLSASYEDRCRAIIGTLPDSYRADAVRVYFNHEFLVGAAKDKVASNLAELLNYGNALSENVERVEGSWLDATRQLSAIRGGLSCIPDDRCVEAVVDATTFTRESLIVTCGLLRHSGRDPRIKTTYSAALRHGDWLSKHFRTVRNIMGYPGMQRPALRTTLVILSGFEPERATHLIDEHEPARVLLGYGNPPTVPAFLERNKSEQTLILARQNVSQFEFPATSIQACLDTLEAVLGPSLESENIILAPMNTKLSSLACMVFADRHSQVQLTYCVPGEYNVSDYSTGAGLQYSEILPE
jgi:hypothetical protein